MPRNTQVLTNCTASGPVIVHVKNGKIIRVEPLEFSPDDAGKWTIQARGKMFSPGIKRWPP